jgi:hypothetical protein
VAELGSLAQALSLLRFSDAAVPKFIAAHAYSNGSSFFQGCRPISGSVWKDSR